MRPVSGVPEWRALITELAAAPSDPVLLPQRSAAWAWLWALWVILAAAIAGAFALDASVGLSGRSPPPVIAWPSLPIPILLFGGYAIWLYMFALPVVSAFELCGARRYNAQLARFGLAVIESPRLMFVGRRDRIKGTLRITGRRRGRLVLVTAEFSGLLGSTAVTVPAPSPPFELGGEGGQLLAKPGTPARVVQLLAVIGRAAPWCGVTVTTGVGGITVLRRSGWLEWRWFPPFLMYRELERRWFYDLWLAECLADALASPVSSSG